MRLRYSISLISQIMYMHGRNPKFLYVDWDSEWPHIWIECDNTAHHYPRKIDVHNINNGPYQGTGLLIPNEEYSPWQFYDCGPGTTEEFNSTRFLPSKYLDRKDTQ